MNKVALGILKNERPIRPIMQVHYKKPQSARGGFAATWYGLNKIGLLSSWMFDHVSVLQLQEVLWKEKKNLSSLESM